MSSSTIHILCTGPVDTAAYKGVQVDVIPFISTRPAINDALAKTIEELYSQPLNVVFTSANAVHAVSKQIKHKTNWNIFCIGYATKDAVVQYYGSDAVVDAAANGLALADRILEHAAVKNVVFFCGNKRRNELMDKLRYYDVKVQEVVVYETVNTPQKIGRQYKGILFFSPTGVRSFFSVNTISEKTVLFAIGATTATELQMVSNNTVIVGEEPDKEELLKEAVQYFQRTAKNIKE